MGRWKIGEMIKNGSSLDHRGGQQITFGHAVQNSSRALPLLGVMSWQSRAFCE